MQQSANSVPVFRGGIDSKKARFLHSALQSMLDQLTGKETASSYQRASFMLPNFFSVILKVIEIHMVDNP